MESTITRVIDYIAGTFDDILFGALERSIGRGREVDSISVALNKRRHIPEATYDVDDIRLGQRADALRKPRVIVNNEGELRGLYSASASGLSFEEWKNCNFGY